MDDVFTELIELMIEKETSKYKKEGMRRVLEAYRYRGYLPQYRDWKDMTEEEKLECL